MKHDHKAIYEKYSREFLRHRGKTPPEPQYTLFGLPVCLESIDGSELLFVSPATEWPRSIYIYHNLKTKVIEKNRIINRGEIHPLEIPGINRDIYLSEHKIKVTLKGVTYKAVGSGWKRL